MEFMWSCYFNSYTTQYPQKGVSSFMVRPFKINSYFNSWIDGRVHSQHLRILLRQDIVEANVTLYLRLIVNELEDGHFG